MPKNTGSIRSGGLLCLNGSQVTTECNVWWNNTSPNDDHWTFGCVADTDPNNTIADPVFCDPSSSDWTVRSNSPAAVTDASGCGQRGAFGVGCGPVSIEAESWGSIKAQYR